jgi:hypothetical protein
VVYSVEDLDTWASVHTAYSTSERQGADDKPTTIDPPQANLRRSADGPQAGEISKGTALFRLLMEPLRPPSPRQHANARQDGILEGSLGQGEDQAHECCATVGKT